MDIPQEAQRMLNGLVDLIQRTGASSFQMRYQDDEEPVVWTAVAVYPKKSAIPSVEAAGKSLRTKHLAETAGALDPIMAAWRLAAILVDGGQCVHCRKATMLCESWERPPSREEKRLFCWFVYDPELGRYDQTCGGGRG